MPLIEMAEIAEKVAQIAQAISEDYDGREVTLVPVLKGALPFAADLMRQLTVPVTIDFIRARSYNGIRSQGTVEIVIPPIDPLEGRHVVLVEDILDTGRTTAAVLDRLEAERPASLAVAVLLDKKVNRIVDIEPNYVGFEIDDLFVVGYGLDYNERHRELPAVYILEDA